ncbi:Organelle RRM domain-containing protein 2, mitochondrial [Linum grandiflorum]
MRAVLIALLFLSRFPFAAKVVTDRVSGYSKGFGFVKYATLEDAAKAIEGMDGKFLDGWVIFAEYARARAPPTDPKYTAGPGYGASSSTAYGNNGGFGRLDSVDQGPGRGDSTGSNSSYDNSGGSGYGINSGAGYGNTYRQ